LNHLHRNQPALHARDCEPEGFRWIVADDQEQSVAAFVRFGAAGDPPVVMIANFTPEPRRAYKIGLPLPGRWREILNTDAGVYGGSGMGNLGGVIAAPHPLHGFPASAELTLPPLSTVYFTPADDQPAETANPDRRNPA
jgi:1,4-alpha-glucan branching enzyme